MLAKQMHARRSDEEIALLEVYSSARRWPSKPRSLSEEEQGWIRESGRRRAKLEEAEERRQREELEKAQRQAAIERALADKATAFVELGTDLIYTLDHAEALEKMRRRRGTSRVFIF